jgi:hypothetical protein
MEKYTITRDFYPKKENDDMIQQKNANLNDLMKIIYLPDTVFVYDKRFFIADANGDLKEVSKRQVRKKIGEIHAPARQEELKRIRECYPPGWMDIINGKYYIANSDGILNEVTREIYQTRVFEYIAYEMEMERRRDEKAEQ